MMQKTRAALQGIARSLQTRLGQRANRTVGALLFQDHGTQTIRIARRAHQQLRDLGYRAHSYQTCLITEAQCLRAAARYGPPNPAWAGVTMPLARLMAFQLRRNLLSPCRVAIQSLHRLRFQRQREPQITSAGIFEGMGYRFRSSADSAQIDHDAATQLSSQAQALLATYRLIAPAAHGNGSIGILISCFQPEAHIEGFLDNLISLDAPERLVPVIINAGMSKACANMIEARLNQANFQDVHILEHPGSGIYEAWNLGIKALGDSVEFITNFNVDDRRHPLCLTVQAECLNTFPQKQVAVTDYTYFFEPKPSVEDLYAHNIQNTTHIPVINERTLNDRNFPHASPLWRRTLHQEGQCGLFNTTYRSAGDAEFWYRVSRSQPNPFSVISIPLSLYYQNPHGLSTRPQTEGASEHSRCTADHYRHLMAKIDAAISPEFAKHHIHPGGPEHLQLYSLASCLRET